jgi:hypothetical protein
VSQGDAREAESKTKCGSWQSEAQALHWSPGDANDAAAACHQKVKVKAKVLLHNLESSVLCFLQVQLFLCFLETFVQIFYFFPLDRGGVYSFFGFLSKRK